VPLLVSIDGSSVAVKWLFGDASAHCEGGSEVVAYAIEWNFNHRRYNFEVSKT
jgi:hypothetical protein